MAHTRPGKRRDGPLGLPGGSICPFESSLGVAWQTVYQKFSRSTTLTPPIVSDPRAPCRIDDSTLSFERIDHDVYIDKAGPGPEDLGLLSE